MLSLQAQCVLPLGATLGEGPLWQPELQRLLFVDIKGQRLHAYTPADGAHQTWDFPDYVCWVAPRSDGDGLMLGLRRAVARLWLEAVPRWQLLDLPLALAPDVRLNDAKVHPDGSLWFGSMNNRDVQRADGRLFQLRAGQLHEHARDIHICNGPAFSPDGRVMFHNDSLRGRTDRFVLPDGAPQLWRQCGPDDGSPDGMTVDSAGQLWVAYWGAGCVLCHGPDGAVRARVDLPVSQPSSVAFGGPDLRTLFITSATEGLATPEPLAGGLFAVRVEVPGLPAATYHDFA
ncbi:SMP-30/gluconolactonase/LRE family protein [Massilia sp. TS11]|uniref:SMP-30/gluconolactonase/LRE family protein n=1 Tax=Massilia sp. TS11 TaxID=2908003 RepID=UPI001EDBB776|nr:SMP-30/gluconolactonase/LRE family protein [Massilia sp. TS11]MCG2586794.1 SMP-30/gluconolactonase/LRE family protein [Massilia sp. TS11]